MTIKTYFSDFRRRYLTTMFLSKLTLITLNSSFIALDLIVSLLIWIDIYRLESIKVDLPEEAIDAIVSTKKCGIILTSGIVITISILGILGALHANSNLLITYDVIGLITILVLLLGWRNYQYMWPIYIGVISAILCSLIVALVYIKTIKDEPYRIRRELLMVNISNMRESVLF